MGSKAIVTKARNNSRMNKAEKQSEDVEEKRKALQTKFLSQAKDLSANNKVVLDKPSNSNLDTGSKKACMY